MPDDDHHADDADAVGFGVLTISSSRSIETDVSGDTLASAIETAGHTVAVRDLVGDDERAIRRRIAEMASHESADAVVTTGGTGLTPEDVTVEAVEVLFEREIPGFGEQFRARSVEDIGPMGMITRATAGIVGGTAATEASSESSDAPDGVPVFSLPGSEQAASLGIEDLILPVVGHVVGLASDGGHGHDHGDHDDHDQHHGGHE